MNNLVYLVLLGTVVCLWIYVWVKMAIDEDGGWGAFAYGIIAMLLPFAIVVWWIFIK